MPEPTPPPGPAMIGSQPQRGLGQRIINAIQPGPLQGDQNLRAIAAPDVPKTWTEKAMFAARDFIPEIQAGVQGMIAAGNVPEYGVPQSPEQQTATIQTFKEPPNVVARGAGTAIGETAESLTRPDVAVPLAALAAGGAVAGPVSVGTASIGLAFDAQMIQGLIEKSPQFKQAWDAGDTESMIRLGTSMGIDAGLLGSAVAHRVRTMRQAPSIKSQPIEPPHADVVQERLSKINDAGLMGEYRAADGDPVYQAEIRAQALQRGLAWARGQEPPVPPNAGQLGGQPPAPKPAGPKPPAVGPAPAARTANVDPDLAAKAIAAVEGKYRVGVKALAKTLNVDRPTAEGLFGWLEANGHVTRGTNKAGETFFKPTKQPASEPPKEEPVVPSNQPVEAGQQEQLGTPAPIEQPQDSALDTAAMQAEIDRIKAENAKLRGEEIPAPAPIETKPPVAETPAPIPETQQPSPVPTPAPVEMAPAHTTPVETPSTQVEKQEVSPATQAETEVKPPHKFGSTQVNLPEPLASKMKEAAARIPDEDLAEDGREDEPHITVKYGLKDDSPAQVEKLRAALSNVPPVRVRMGKTSLFPEGEPGKGEVVKVDVDSPDLHALNQLVKDTVDTEDTHPTYTPHATLGYVKAGLGKKYEGDTFLEGQEASFDHILVSTRDRQKIPIRLGGQPETKTSPSVTSPVEAEASGEFPQERLKSGSRLQFIPRQNEDGTWKAEADREIQGLLGGYGGESRSFPTKDEAYADLARKVIEGLQANVVNDTASTVADKHRSDAQKLQQWAMKYIPEGHRPTLRDRNQWAEVLAATTPEKAETEGFSAREQGGKFRVHAPDGTMIAWAKDAPDGASAIAEVHRRAVRSFAPPKENAPAEATAKREPSAERVPKAAENIPQNIPQEIPAPAPMEEPTSEVPEFRQGDRVRYTNDKGQELTGTVRRDFKPNDPGVDVDVDQIMRAGGVPIGRLEYWPKGRVRRIEADLPAPEIKSAHEPQVPEPLDVAVSNDKVKAGATNDEQSTPDSGALADKLPETSERTPGERRSRSPRGGGSGPRSRRDGGGDRQGSELEPSSRVGDGGVEHSPSDDLEHARPPRPTSTGRKRFEGDYRIADGRTVSGSPEVRADRNIKAIQLVRQLDKAKRPATVEEQQVLAGYVGWGAVPQIFAANTPEWKERDTKLRDLLSTEEYDAARRSTTNAHYTSDTIVDAIWDAVKHLGAKPGMSWLEPAVGVGNFFGRQPADLLDGARRVGIEKDAITGQIAKYLYPDSGIEISPFEKADLPSDFFDAAVSNVPFGDFGVHDPTFRDKKFLTESIHNYFFAKAMTLARPGGVVAFVTSRYTMDGYEKGHKAVRNWLAGHADLVGAVRLPSGAFRQNAGTDVITDIIFLRKRLPDDERGGEAWQDVKGLSLTPKDSYSTRNVPINEYFHEHPEMVLGEHGLNRGQFSAYDYDVKGSLTPERLQQAIESLPKDQFRPWRKARREGIRVASVDNADTAKVGALFFDPTGDLFIRTSRGNVEKVDVPKPTLARIKGQLGIRDAVVALLDAERLDKPAAELNKLRKDLNNRYDAYTGKHGLLSSRANQAAIDGDPDAPLVLALEKDYNQEAKTANKAPIFSRRMLEPTRPVEKVEGSKEALTVSLNERGRIDWDRMAELTGKSPEQMQEDLAGLTFEDPVTREWLTADDYLSGSVRAKLKAAKAAAKADPQYQAHVDALEAVQPEDIPHSGIKVRLGVSWIPKDVYAKFVQHLTGTRDMPTVTYLPALGEWHIDFSRWQQTVRKWETKRVDTSELIRSAFNMRQLKVYDRDLNGNATVNPQETAAANSRLEELQDEFQNWIFADPDRGMEMARLYNDAYNDLRLPTWDGSHLTLPGMTRNESVLRGGDLAPHQKNAVWRVISQPNVLLAHAVGAGKTYEMIAGGMELQRLGLARRPMYVVPNQTLTGWQEQFTSLYPEKRVLVFSEADLEKKKRQRVMAKIALGNWDAVVVPQSSFGLIPVSDALFEKHFEERANELEAAIHEAAAAGMDTRMIKRMEKAKEKLLKSLEDRRNADRQDNLVTWEQLGIDQMFVDESHNYKKLGFSTKQGNIAGIDQGGNQRTFDLMMKMRHTQRYGRGVVFATGTPVTNTMGEMFSIMRYLIPDELAARGFTSFDEWAAHFGRTVSVFEPKPEGGGYKVKQRFAKFVNLPELVTLFRTFSDVVTSDMLDLPRPELRGGERTIVSSEMNDAQLQVMEDLQRRAERVRKDPRRALPDNMLAIFTDAQKAAMDIRMLEPTEREQEGSRVVQAADRIHRIWKETAEKKSAQIVMSDLGKPTEAGGQEFSFYDALIDGLVQRGIPRNEIAHIYSAKNKTQRRKLFERVRTGEIRVVLGSTDKLGVGVNVQDKLIALHHLDIPHRPADVENGKAALFGRAMRTRR
ncbi:MAG: 2'-5' RNA ligase family protein [Paludibaculum sp.]